jgi:hypothetical protein
MAKKDIKTAAESANAFDIIATGTTDTKDTQDTKGTASTREVYRMNLKMPVEFKEYLMAQAYRQSNEKHIVSVTEYICNLIREDMERNSGK